MHSSTYKDIIDEKIAEWLNGLQRLEDHAEQASPETRSRLSEKAIQLKSAIDAAAAQLQTLDEQETVSNTMETKNRIMAIFNSIDKDFPVDMEKTPFML